MRLWLIPALGLAAAGCVLRQHPPPPPPPPELGAAAADCAATVFPLNPRVAAWSVDKFTGRYARGAEVLTIARREHRLLVTRPGFGTREIAAPDVENWTWHDGCGVRYRFTLPPDGPGAWLRVIEPGGTAADWHRAGY